MTILLEDEDNNPIYKNTAKECNVSNELLILKQGSYHIRYEYDIDEYDMYDSDIFVDWFITK